MFGRRVHGVRHHGPAHVEVDTGPLRVFIERVRNGGNRLFVVHERRSRYRRAIDGIHVVTGNADPPPFTPREIAQTVRVERFGRHLDALGIGLPPTMSQA